MNVLVMMGRLTRDPEVRYGASGNAVARFSLAVDRRFKREGQPDADFFNCVTFGRQAEFVEKYLHKGVKIVIQGSLQNDNYENREGQMVYRDQIVIDNIEFAESKAASQQNEQNQQSGGQSRQSGGQSRQNSGQSRQNNSQSRQNSGQNRQNGGQSRQNQPLQEDSDGFMNIPDGIDEELPFN